MRQVHDLHDAVDDGHADRHGGINSGQQQGLQNRSRYSTASHEWWPGLSYLPESALPASPVAASFGINDFHFVVRLVLHDDEGMSV